MKKEVIVPRQKKGMKTGAKTKVNLESEKDARLLFAKAKRRLQDINNWHLLSGMGSATFVLTDRYGRKIRRQPRKGDRIMIDLPGPGTVSGNGYDWVEIEEVKQSVSDDHNEELFGIRTRPVAAPRSKEKTTSHFYTHDASSTFVIIRKGTTVSAAEYGRNEIPNTGARSIADRIRNTAVSLGAMLGLSSVQWKKLMNGILGEE